MFATIEGVFAVRTTARRWYPDGGGLGDGSAKAVFGVDADKFVVFGLGNHAVRQLLPKPCLALGVLVAIAACGDGLAIADSAVFVFVGSYGDAVCFAVCVGVGLGAVDMVLTAIGSITAIAQKIMDIAGQTSGAYYLGTAGMVANAIAFDVSKAQFNEAQASGNARDMLAAGLGMISSASGFVAGDTLFASKH